MTYLLPLVYALGFLFEFRESWKQLQKEMGKAGLFMTCLALALVWPLNYLLVALTALVITCQKRWSHWTR